MMESIQHAVLQALRHRITTEALAPSYTNITASLALSRNAREFTFHETQLSTPTFTAPHNPPPGLPGHTHRSDDAT